MLAPIAIFGDTFIASQRYINIAIVLFKDLYQIFNLTLKKPNLKIMRKNFQKKEANLKETNKFTKRHQFHCIIICTSPV